MNEPKLQGIFQRGNITKSLDDEALHHRKSQSGVKMFSSHDWLDPLHQAVRIHPV